MQPDQSIMTQLTDFNEWSKTGPQQHPLTLLDYVGFVATPDLLFGFAALFWPDLIIHDGLHFLASGFSTEVYDQWQRAGKTPCEIQRVMNHVHVSTLLQQQAISDETAVEAARTIAMVWSRTIGPEGLITEAVGGDLDDAAVTFFTSKRIPAQE